MKSLKNKLENIIKKGNQLWEKFINLKIIKTIFLFLPHNFFLFLLFLLSVGLIVTFDYNRFIPIYTYEGVANSSFEPIIEDPLTLSLENINKEEFLETEKEPNNLCIRFATYDRKNNAEYKYSVYKKEEKIYEENFNAKILDDGKFTCFSLPEVTKENSQEYKVEIAPIRVNRDNAITIFKNAQTGEVALQLAYEQPIFSIKTIFVLVFFLLNLVVYYVINTKKIAIEKFWLLLSLIYIIPITLINPPYEVPDEPIHFYSAYRLTQRDKSKGFYESLESPYMTMPNSIGCLGYANIQTRDKVVDSKEVLECFKNTENTTKKSIYSYVGTKIAFFASSIGITIADFFTNSPGIIFYMGRLFNALFSIFVIYKALKIAPKHKELLLVVATLPMFLQQMTSYSYDAFLNTFSILATAIILKMIYDEKANFKWCTILLLLSGMIISNIKLLYLPIFLMLLFLPNEKFNRKIDKYIYTFGVIVESYLLGNLCAAITDSGNITTIFSTLFTLLMVGISLKMNLEKKTNWKVELSLLFLSSVVVAFANPLYLIVNFFLLLFVPNAKFKKKWHKYAGILGLCLVAFGLGQFGVSLLSSPTASVSTGSSKVMSKLMDLVYHPMKAITLAYCTLKMKTIFYLRSLVGYFGWFNFRLNDIYVIAYIFFVLYLLFKTEFVKNKWYEKGIVLLGLLVGVAGVFLAMYVYWSGAELFYIDGVQGRYFIPLLIPLLLLFTTSKKKKGLENVEKNTYTFITTILLEYVSLLLLFYY